MSAYPCNSLDYLLDLRRAFSLILDQPLVHELFLEATQHIHILHRLLHGRSPACIEDHSNLLPTLWHVQFPCAVSYVSVAELCGPVAQVPMNRGRLWFYLHPLPAGSQNPERWELP